MNNTKVLLAGTRCRLAPQTTEILKHLVTVGTLSGVEAQALYKARSVTKRVSEINSYLHDVAGPEAMLTSEWSVDATGQRYKRYTMPAATRRAIGFATSTQEG